MTHPEPSHPAMAYGIAVGERFSQSMSALLVPLWALALHAPASIIGLDVAAASLAPMAFSIPIGAAADRLGSRRIVVIGSLLAFLATALCAAVPNYWLLGLWQTLAGLGRSAAWIGAQTLITKSAKGSTRTGRVGWLSLSAQIGNFLGPVLAGLLVAHLGILIAFLTSSVAIGAVAVLVAVWPGRDPAPTLAREANRAPGADFVRAFKLIRSRPMQVMSVATVVRLSMVALRVSFYVVFLHQWGFNPVTIGLIFSLCSMASAVAAALAGVAARHVGQFTLLWLGLLGMMAGMALAPLNPIFGYQTGCMILFGLGNGTSQPALISLLAEATSSGERGLALGLRTTLNRVAQVGCPLLLGILATWMAIPTLLILFSCVGAAGMGWVSLPVKESKLSHGKSA